MRDYKKDAQDLRRIAKFQNCFECFEGERTEGSCSSRCTLSRAADAIEELVARVPKWISVEERLPEEEKPVFVTYIGYNTGSLHSDMIAYQDGEGDWRYYDGDNGSDICKVDITHWMPLPEPPKGVE